MKDNKIELIGRDGSVTSTLTPNGNGVYEYEICNNLPYSVTYTPESRDIVSLDPAEGPMIYVGYKLPTREYIDGFFIGKYGEIMVNASK